MHLSQLVLSSKWPLPMHMADTKLYKNLAGFPISSSLWSEYHSSAENLPLGLTSSRWPNWPLSFWQLAWLMPGWLSQYQILTDGRRGSLWRCHKLMMNIVDCSMESCLLNEKIMNTIWKMPPSSTMTISHLKRDCSNKPCLMITLPIIWENTLLFLRGLMPGLLLFLRRSSPGPRTGWCSTSWTVFTEHWLQVHWPAASPCTKTLHLGWLCRGFLPKTRWWTQDTVWSPQRGWPYTREHSTFIWS